MTASLSDNTTRDDIQDVSDLIIGDFHLEEKQDTLVSRDMQEFREKLRILIKYMLDREFEKLLNAMYRLDINEEKFKMVLSNQESQDVALDIADLVIEREMQKVITRRKYREGKL